MASLQIYSKHIVIEHLSFESNESILCLWFSFEASGKLQPTASRLFVSLPALGVRASTVTLGFWFSELPLPNVTSWPQDKRLNSQNHQIIRNLYQSQHPCQVHHLFHLQITHSQVNHIPCSQYNCSLKKILSDSLIWSFCGRRNILHP